MRFSGQRKKNKFSLKLVFAFSIHANDIFYKSIYIKAIKATKRNLNNVI